MKSSVFQFEMLFLGEIRWCATIHVRCLYTARRPRGRAAGGQGKEGKGVGGMGGRGQRVGGKGRYAWTMLGPQAQIKRGPTSTQYQSKTIKKRAQPLTQFSSSLIASLAGVNKPSRLRKTCPNPSPNLHNTSQHPPRPLRDPPTIP